MASSVLPFLFFLLLLFLNPGFSQANLHHSKTLLRSTLPSQQSPTDDTIAPPTLFFEVTKPISVPHTKPCSLTVLHHDFGYTYGKSPVLANYTFPHDCSFQEFSRIVLEWNATCKGRQFDRIFGVWLSGVELLRSCTAEPRPTGIVWSVKKDVTKYSSLLLMNKTQTFSVYIGNLIDETYTGVYHVNVSLYFYPAVEKKGDVGSETGSKADLIIPFSRDLPLKDGLWFEIQNSTDVKGKEFEIPRNVYKAVLEVYVSFHEKDEFWYGNPPTEYIVANNLTDFPGNGPFREVLVSLDGEHIGAIWPFTVVYTGGINPLFWRPISAIGSFDLPTYDIEITPFLGKLLDGKSHNLSFSVTNALNVWYIDANLHLWLDCNSKTKGKLLHHNIGPLVVSSVTDFHGLDGKFVTKATRSISSTGWIKSSYGKITTISTQDLSYRNSMVMAKDGNLQTVNQKIRFNNRIHSNMPGSSPKSKKTLKRFLFNMYYDYSNQGNGASLTVANVTLGFNEKRLKDKVRNLQKGNGLMAVKDNLVVNGVGNTSQMYIYNGPKSCYSRDVSSSNYTILHDKVRKNCKTSFGI
ncbi:hypothetical protein like AT3G14920 [Hibiscus trionum]|uniref:Peptide N-acetyl-beta-D-glucosaminyl asparaginase amidase A N-terminal domain-containing protein n=1 Tax=Hibiscus trionum TaxID=183268 RepID=A0A9W7GUZ0_HIBTR|nr:hypothetical protein like AT3G14920 [Hibiscus trionum]